MKVYVLIHGYDYEGEIIHGVFATPEAANESLMDLVKGMRTCSAPREYEGDVTYDGPGQFVTLRKYDVQS